MVFIGLRLVSVGSPSPYISVCTIDKSAWNEDKIVLKPILLILPVACRSSTFYPSGFQSRAFPFDRIGVTRPLCIPEPAFLENPTFLDGNRLPYQPLSISHVELTIRRILWYQSSSAGL